MTPSPFRRLPGAPSLSHKGRGTASLRLFEHVLRVLRGGRQAHRITLDIGDEADGDVMMLRALAVRPLRAVGLGQLDPVTVQVIDGADMDTVRADHVHMFPATSEKRRVGK